MIQYLLLFDIKTRTLGFRFLSTPKKVLTKISHPKKVTTKFQTQKMSSDRKFQTQKRASHIPFTYVPEYHPWGSTAEEILEKVLFCLKIP